MTASAFRPMLAAVLEDTTTLRFPLLASPKLDGIRCLMVNGRAVSRSLKPIANQYVREWLEANVLAPLDGELMLPPPATFQDITSAFMSRSEHPPEGWFYAVFDVMSGGSAAERQRVLLQLGPCARVQIVNQVEVKSLNEILPLEEHWLAQGYEGVMLRNPEGHYKHGRSTSREGLLLKLKRFEDSEAEIIGVVELQRNGNEATINELGLCKRSTSDAGKSAGGTLGALQVRDIKSGTEFEIGTGYTAEQRADLWARRETLIGQLVKYKHFTKGAKDRPRFPVFLGLRSREDI